MGLDDISNHCRIKRFARMNQQTIGIYSGRDDLVGRLREASPSLSFATDGDQRESCRVVVIDADSHELLDNPPRKSLVRVVLCNGAMPANRRRGEIRVERGVFLDAPGEYLGFAYDLADTAVHASILEQEVSY